MKTIEVDDELYRYIASQTKHIGESASDILRRMLKFTAGQTPAATPTPAAPERAAAPVVEEKPANTARNRVRAVRELLLSDEYAAQNKAVNRFMMVLSTLYQLDAKTFGEATESLHGRTRVYFCR
ncbi:Negative modulator of initiation of replication [Cedecea neteri]|uniref:Negative modulator of initiation of replication n=1 Tax=Cedecea neteri TaxID=158822 RepID=A0A2X2SXN2_9ENTR|nr:Negative modulator of initiation of replication [Cedecea neteri]